MKTAIIVILLLSVAISAQEKCDLTIRDAPRLLKLTLGMSSTEVNKAFGRDLKVKVKPKGQRSFFRNYIKKSARGSLQGIRALFLRFHNGLLYQIELFYNDDYNSSDLTTFINKYSAKNNFPVSLWRIKHGYAKVKCNGFSLKADSILNPHIEMTDEATYGRIETEKKEKKTQKEKEKAGN
jgi:hypothetical protein